MKNKYFTFAPFLQGTNFKSLFCTAFFIAISLGYLSDGCRAKRPIIVPCRTEKGSLSLFNTLSFSSFMQGTTKNYNGAKYSNADVTPIGAKSDPTTGTPAGITVIITGKKNNRYIHALSKAAYELLIDETRGNIFAEHRFIKMYEAANLLYPEERRALRGLTVKFM